MKTTKGLTQLEFGRLVGRSRERINQLVLDGRLPALPSGRLELAAALPAFVAYLDARVSAKTGADARIKNARAEKLELGNDATRRDLIPLEEVKRDVTRLGNELRTQLLVIPRQLETACGRDFAERVEKEILSVLETIANSPWVKEE